MSNYKVTVTFNQQSLGRAINVFWFSASEVSPGNTAFLAAVEDWVDAMYSPLQPFMDAGCVLAQATVDRVSNTGAVAAFIGAIAPAISGSASGNQGPNTAAATLTARTLIPKVRGSKRVPGISTSVYTDALLNNAILNAMASMVIEWTIGPVAYGITGALAGVLSTTLDSFVPFSGSGIVTNIPGTQVTRKPGRGS